MASSCAHVRLRLALLCAATLLATPALALDNDPVLGRLCSGGTGNDAVPCGESPQPDTSAFKKLVREYGMTFAPRLLAPAETAGVNGFQFDFAYGLTNINDDEDYWKRAVKDQSPDPVLHTLQIGVTKGLPYSVEVGALATWLLDSEMFAFGGMAKVAPNEAIDAFPVDVAMRVAVNRLVGSSDLDLTTVSLDFEVSRSFGGGGVANVAPYMAYEPVWAIGRSGVLDSTPGRADDPARSFVFGQETEVLHRFVLGSRFVLGAANFTPEIVLTKGLQSYAFKLGLDF